MANKKVSNIAPFGLRLQPELKIALESAAATNERSLNAEIASRLEQSFQARVSLPDFSDGELVDELIKRWGRDQVLIRLGKNTP